MSKDYRDITADLNKSLLQLRKGKPGMAKGFGALAAGAMEGNVLDKKTKELIALAIGVATRCDGAIGFHSKALVELGATRDEIMDVLGMCVYMGGGPSYMYAADALSAFDQFNQ